MASKSENKSKSLFDHLNQIRGEKDETYYKLLTEDEKKGFNQYIILTGLSMDKSCIEEGVARARGLGPGRLLPEADVIATRPLEEVVADGERGVDGEDELLLLVHGSLGPGLATAFAERLHQHVRTSLWGYAPE